MNALTKVEGQREVGMLMKQKPWMGMSFSLVELAVDEKLNNLQSNMQWEKQFSRLCKWDTT